MLLTLEGVRPRLSESCPCHSIEINVVGVLQILFETRATAKNAITGLAAKFEISACDDSSAAV